MDFSVILISVGEPTEEYAIESIKYQTRKPNEFVIVRNVSPISKACNTGYSQIHSDYVIEVASDFILKPDTFEIMSNNFRPEDGQIYGTLWDIERQIMIDSMMMYNRKAMHEIGYYRDVPRCDVDVGERLRKAGWKTRKIDVCFGLHLSQHTTAKRFATRQWNGGKGLGLRELMHGTKTSLLAFKNTRKMRYLIAPEIMIAGRFLGKNEDVRL